MRVEFRKGIQPLGDMRAHRALGVVPAAFEYGRSDDAVVCIGKTNALRVVEGGEQQSIDGHGETREKLRDVQVA